MRRKLLFFVLTGSLIVLAAWLVHVPSAAHADDEVPEKYRGTVGKGLDYLAAKQCKDGHWEADDGKHPVAMTALVGMAFLMECSENFNRGKSNRGDSKYAANVNRAIDWLIGKSRPNGLIFSAHPSETDRYMYGHGLATQFLAWAHAYDAGEPRQEKLFGILERSVKYIAQAQSSQGGWYRTSKVEGHDFDEILATAMQIQALYSLSWGTDFVDLQRQQSLRTLLLVPLEYNKQALAKYEDGAKPGPTPGRPTETAAVLACQAINTGKSHNLSETWWKYCQMELPTGLGAKFGRDEFAHYYYAQALFPGDTWTNYRTAMFDQLHSKQNKDGSWPAGDGIMAGSVFSTAIWCTILQLDRNCHPLAHRVYKVR